MSRRDDLVQAFDALALARKYDDRPKMPEYFAGGFHPGYAPLLDSYEYDLATLPSMPNPHDPPVQYPPPGNPPTMPIPQTHKSRTMTHALGLVAQSRPTRPSPNLIVPAYGVPSRPQSDSAIPTQSLPSPSSISQGPPQTSAPRRSRASSVPISPTSAKSSSSKDKETQQCEGVTRAGVRCTRQVKASPPLTTIQPNISIERFCFQHSKDVLSPSGFYSRKNKTVWIKFEEWIPDYLQEDTKVALRVEMEKARSSSDVPGYIYTYEIRDPKTPKKLHLKVGRAVNLVKRIDQWGKQCGSKEPVLRGWWPGTVEDNNEKGNPSLMKGRVKAGDKGMWCHRLERLVHLELADLVVSGIYLECDFRVRRGGGGGQSTARSLSVGGAPKKVSVGSGGKKKYGEICVDCGAVHKEIFTFTRIERGMYKGKEWEDIVKPMIEKWGDFVNTHV